MIYIPFLVQRLHPTLIVQMFPAYCFHLCLHLLSVTVRISYTCSVQVLVRTGANRALSGVTHSCRCHHCSVQYKPIPSSAKRRWTSFEHNSFRLQ